MDYKLRLSALVDKYYGQIIMKYQGTTTAAMQKGRKMGLFKKVDFSEEINDFQKHIDDAEKIDTSTIDIPETDIKTMVLEDCLNNSIASFCVLCEKCKTFYDISDRKQYKGSGVNVSIYKEAFVAMQEAAKVAAEDVNVLDKAYEEFNAENSEE
ncbi:hypothetical protein M2140_001744 [Clostridiales Family XIII bacterium PM5-7]